MSSFQRSVECVLILLLSLCASQLNALEMAHYAAGDDWAYYNGNPAGTHYSTLKQINTNNVSKLTVAWTYDTREKLGANSTIESNPLVIDEKLFFISPGGRLICLDGSTGAERWIFDPGAGQTSGSMTWRRGVAFWTDGKKARILFTFGTDLYSVDAQNGRLDQSFGQHGRIALGANVSSPGAVFEDLIILGGASHTVRAFNVKTGTLQWTFHGVPRPGEFGHHTWPRDAWRSGVGPNSWAGLTVDVGRGIVFAPFGFTGNFYGAKSQGDNLFANSLVALDARTGRRLWHLQTIRHDVWDRDLASPPTLVTVSRNGRRVDAVAQVSKIGFVYILDRQNGQSLFPLVEVPAFASDLPGEQMAKTQLVPLAPAPFARQHLTTALLTQRTPQVAAEVAARFSRLRSRGLWDPPSEQGTVVFPGLEGGAEWGGAAYDPESGLLYISSNELASILRVKRMSQQMERTGADVYRTSCAACHGENQQGGPGAPSLKGTAARLSFSQMTAKIATGGAGMPAFPELATDYIRLWPLMDFLRTGTDSPIWRSEDEIAAERSMQDVYVLDGLPKFVDVEGYPATVPPWGTLNAINVNTGAYAWKIPLGEYPELSAKGLKDTGSENYGGPIVTAGGLLFIGATSFDKKFRAYDKKSGELLWEATLPAAGNATPSTYRSNGRQFVVIAAGGGRPPRADPGSKIVAFSLP